MIPTTHVVPAHNEGVPVTPNGLNQVAALPPTDSAEFVIREVGDDSRNVSHEDTRGTGSHAR